MTVQRDWGDRTNRKHARLKYTIEDRGLAAFRAEVERRIGKPLERSAALPFRLERRPLRLGRGRGRTLPPHAVHRERPPARHPGRAGAADRACAASPRSTTASSASPRTRTSSSPMCAPENRAAIDALVAEHGLTSHATALRRNAMACVALPTCGLALAESERYLPDLVTALEERLRAARPRRGRDHDPHDRLPERLRAALHRRDRPRRQRARPLQPLSRRAPSTARACRSSMPRISGTRASSPPSIRSLRPMRRRAPHGRALRRLPDPRRHVAATANGADFHANTGPLAGRAPAARLPWRPPHDAPHRARRDPARPPRALAKLPIFLDLAGRRVRRRRRRRARRLEGRAPGRRRRAGVRVCARRAVAGARRRSPPPTAAITLVRARLAARAISTAPRSRSPRREGEEAARFAAAARGRGALVNVIDQPAFCDFQFGAIVNRSPVVVSISTDGAAPILAPGDPPAHRGDPAAGPRRLGRDRARASASGSPRILPSKAGAARLLGAVSSTSPSSRRPRRTSASPSSSASPRTILDGANRSGRKARW